MCERRQFASCVREWNCYSHQEGFAVLSMCRCEKGGTSTSANTASASGKKKRSQSIRKLKLWEFHWIIKILFRADPRNQPPYVIWSCRFHAFVPVLPKLRPATIVETCCAKHGDGGNENSPDLNATCETSDHYEKTRGPCHRTQGLSLRLSDAIQKKATATLPPTNRHLQPATEPEALFGSRSTHNWIVYSVAWHGRCR